MLKCFKELNEKQYAGSILWLPAPGSGSLLQPVALGGNHGFKSDNDLDIQLVTTLDLDIYEHCSNDAIGNFGFTRVEQINRRTIPKHFQNRCECEFNGMQMICQANAYELLEQINQLSVMNPGGSDRPPHGAGALSHGTGNEDSNPSQNGSSDEKS